MTAVQLVSGYSGFGVHTFLSIIRGFPGLYKNFVFISVAEVDAGAFKESESVGRLTSATKDSLKKYVDLARRLGFPAESRFDTGIDVVGTAAALCERVAREFPRSTVFAGQTVFRPPGSSTASSTTRRPSPSSRGFAGRASRRSFCPSASTSDGDMYSLYVSPVDD